MVISWKTNGPWEYRVVYLDQTNIYTSTNILNTHGQDGWELVSTNEDRAYFKRPTQAEEDDDELIVGVGPYLQN